MIKHTLQLIKKGVALLLAALAMLLFLIEAPQQKEDYHPDNGTQTFMLLDALLRGQGITTDGEHYYFSWNYGITKTKLDGTTVVQQNLLAIPWDLLQLGCKHIGGISYMHGKIYAPIEDSKVFEHLYIATFDAKTLQHIESYALPLENHENGVPWCVADAENNVVYSARRDHITQINVYSGDTLALLDVIDLEQPVHKVQGGEMYDGILYLSVSRGDQAVYAVDLSTGKVRKAISRNLVEGSEGEGMTILPTADGALLHVLDIASVRIGVHLRHYAFDPDSIDWS